MAQPPASGTAAAGVLHLADVVAQVRAANPSLGRAASLIAAQRAHVAQTGVLPDPNVTVSWMGRAVPFSTMGGDPSSYRGVSVMQMIPLGGKLASQREVARRDEAVEESSRVATEAELVSAARSAFYDYRYYGRALAITASNRERLVQLAEITEARYRVGKAMQQDVLQARLQISMLLQRTAQLEQQRLAATARLNTLMGNAADTPLPPAEPEGALPPLPPLQTLASLAAANDPMLARESRMAERERAMLALSSKDNIPDLSVGYMYQERDGMPDMHGAQFTINLPIFHRDRLRQEVAESRLRLRAATQAEESRRLEAANELRQAYAAAETARQLADLYEKAILPQAELARDSAQASYTVGNVDFLTVVSSYNSIYAYELDNSRQRADYRMALARIEALTGDLDSLNSPTIPAAPAAAPEPKEAK